MIRQLLLASVAVACFAAAAEPFVPQRDSDVLERLPSRIVRNARPVDDRDAWNEARRLIEAARREGDPRHLGRAQALLKRWWSQPQPPMEVLLLRATIRQALHEFDTALADLDALLEREPRHAQALLTRASVLLARGRPAEAQRDCLRLAGLAEDLVVVACATHAASVSGHGQKSHEALQIAYDASARAQPAVRLWALTLLGEMAARLGRESAETHFTAALRMAPRDAYALGAYADWLLDRHRGAEVARLIAADEPNDALLLRRVLALRALDDPRAGFEAQVMRARFEAQRQRGESLHAREEARFRLAFDADPHEALRLARLNFEQQREPADVRVLLEAARRAGDAAAMRPALDWLARTRHDDIFIRPLLAKVS